MVSTTLEMQNWVQFRRSVLMQASGL